MIDWVPGTETGYWEDDLAPPASFAHRNPARISHSSRIRAPSRGWLGAATCAVWLALAAPVHAAEPVRSNPGHLRPPPDDDPNFDLYAPQRWAKTPLVVMRSKAEWRTAGKLDRALSNACAAHRFLEIIPMLYRAVFVDDVLGVAFGHGLNLRDLDRKAKPDMIYLFRFGGTTGCEVVTMKNKDPAVSPPGAGAGKTP